MITSCTGWSMWLACTQRKHGEFEHICNGSSHLITPTPSLWVPIACLWNYTVDPMFSSYSPPSRLQTTTSKKYDLWKQNQYSCFVFLGVRAVMGVGQGEWQSRGFFFFFIVQYYSCVPTAPPWNFLCFSAPS